MESDVRPGGRTPLHSRFPQERYKSANANKEHPRFGTSLGWAVIHSRSRARPSQRCRTCNYVIETSWIGPFLETDTRSVVGHQHGSIRSATWFAMLGRQARSGERQDIGLSQCSRGAPLPPKSRRTSVAPPDVAGSSHSPCGWPRLTGQLFQRENADIIVIQAQIYDFKAG
jgi:hypothetical protein